MAVKFSEFSIGTIGASLEIVGFDNVTPQNVQVSYDDIKTDILADAQSPLNGIGFVKISGTTITYDNSTYLTGNQSISLSGAITGSGTTSIATTLANSIVGIANINATGTPSSTTFLRGDGQWATPTGGAATISIGSSITSSTVGSVLFVGTGGLLAQNNANFFWDNTNGRLGIGTATPTRRIDVAGDISVNGATAGRGVGNIATNTAFGSLALNIAPTAGGGNNNTAFGANALRFNNFGYDNTAIGLNALQNNTSGQGNVAVGPSALIANTTATGNIAIGAFAAQSITTGAPIIAIGYQAGRDAITGNNIYIGRNSGRTHSNASCTNNTLIGHNTGEYSTTMNGCTALGQFALGVNSTGNDNIGVGYNAGSNVTTGSNNIFIGTGVQAILGTASNRTFIGTTATVNTWLGGNLLLGSTTDDGVYRLQVTGGAKTTTDCNINTHTLGRGLGNIQTNTAFGYQALNSNTGGDGNTAIGNTALKANTSAYGNTAVGSGALTSNTTGVFNTAIGAGALTAATTASSNVAVGAQAAQSITTATSIVAIGKGAFQNGVASNNIMIGSEAGLTFTSATANDNVLIGNLAGNFSSGYAKTTLVGHKALSVTTTGTNNIAIGFEAGANNTTGSNNIFIGVTLNAASATDSNRTFIGNGSTVTTWLGGNLLLGSTTDNATDRLQVTGSTLITGVLKQTVTTNRQTASYSLVLLDRGKLVEMNVATANNLTVPLNSVITFPIGTQIDISQYGAGQTTVVATSGVTIRSASGALKLAAQYSGGSLVKIGTDEWYLFGDITV